MFARRKRFSDWLARLRRELEAAEPAEAKASLERAFRELEAARDAVTKAWRRLRDERRE
jgi:hypothetical protein